MTRKGQWLVIKRDALCEDSWTYGDWRQYIVFRDNGDACCVRMSMLPFWCVLIGAALLWFPVLAVVYAAQGVDVSWRYVAGLTFAAFALIGIKAALTFTSWRLVVVVLTCTRKGDGSWVRDL